MEKSECISEILSVEIIAFIIPQSVKNRNRKIEGKYGHFVKETGLIFV